MTCETPTDSIFALSSGAGKSGVAVFRISGQKAHETIYKLSTRRISARRVHVAELRDPASGDLIDRGIIFGFAGPASFTGEDMAELQVHGSLAVIDRLSAVLIELGLRPAEPGEFTLRAFHNGKIDLAQAEALSDLIDAETSLQRQQALTQADGRLSARAESWRQQLIRILAPLEAGIDFPDEEDVPAQIEATAVPVVTGLITELERYLGDSIAARRVRRGVSVILLGPPNAGKSSLLNYLAQSEVAIVSDIPGTTRDLIEVRLDLDGIPVSIIDTAGLRDGTLDAIEEEGMRRARQRAAEADLRVGLLDASQEFPAAIPLLDSLTDEDIVLINKIDLLGTDEPVASIARDALPVSVTTGENMTQFLDLVKTRVRTLCAAADEPRLTRLRHVRAVEGAVLSLKRSLDYLPYGVELAAEDVRLAVRRLGGITGLIDVEDVLDDIFSSFCIGK